MGACIDIRLQPQNPNGPVNGSADPLACMPLLSEPAFAALTCSDSDFAGRTHRQTWFDGKDHPQRPNLGASSKTTTVVREFRLHFRGERPQWAVPNPPIPAAARPHPAASSRPVRSVPILSEASCGVGVRRLGSLAILMALAVASCATDQILEGADPVPTTQSTTVTSPDPTTTVAGGVVDYSSWSADVAATASRLGMRGSEINASWSDGTASYAATVEALSDLRNDTEGLAAETSGQGDAR